MKRTIIVMGAITLTSLGNYAVADEPNTGHSTEVIPGDWDDEAPNLNFNFQDIPTAKYTGLQLHLSCGLPNAKVLYTTDSKATQTDESAWTVYTEPLDLTEDCTVRFFARCEGYNDSDIQEFKFVYADHQASAPEIAPDLDRKNILMETLTPNATIRYTFDNSDPDESSTIYNGAVAITANGTFKARSFANDMFPSVITAYTIDFLQAELPSATFENKHLVLSSSDSDSKFYYTLSDAPVTDADAWTLYEAPIALTEDCTYRFFAGDDDANASDVQTFVFQRSDYQIAPTTIERNEEGTHIVMECPTEGAEIRYTTDGSEPTKESNLHTEPVLIVCNGTFRARAVKEGMYDSEVTDFTVSNIAVPVAYASFENKMLTLTCADPEASIWYTNDDDAVPEETENWELYTHPLLLTENCYIHFFTRRDNFNDSDIETFVFLRANYTAATPKIERDEDSRSIIMTTETEGAEIRYTTDGTEPTEESELYTAPVFITQNCIFHARTYAARMLKVYSNLP